MKHEKVAILALAYVIGFVTAYIAFGVEVEYQAGVKTVDFSSAPDSESLGNANTKVGATVKADGLYALFEGKERILSAQVASASEPSLGYHYQIVATEVSPDGKYIYYCAQLVASDEECSNFIYDIAADTVHTVKAENEEGQLKSVIEGISAEWQNGRLSLDEYMSVNGFEPWKVSGATSL